MMSVFAPLAEAVSVVALQWMASNDFSSSAIRLTFFFQNKILKLLEGFRLNLFIFDADANSGILILP